MTDPLDDDVSIGKGGGSMPNQERTEEQILSPLQRMQLRDADEVSRRRDTPNDTPDQTPPWVAAGMTWTAWAAQLDRDSAIGVAPNEALPDA